MYAKLPSMKSLIAFEAVARHQSIVNAANEVALTSSALSKQIQALETQIGVKLFVRTTRRIELTEQGKQFAATVKESLRSLQQAITDMNPVSEKPTLRLLASAGFASYVLVPKLAGFKAICPEASFSFVSDPGLGIPDFDRESLDGAFMFLPTPPERTDVVGIPLFQGCYLQPMCAPELLADGRPVTNIAQLSQLVWLKNRKAPLLWDAWLCSAGAAGLQPSEVIWFDDSVSILEAAAAGMGIAMIAGADSAPNFTARLVPAHPSRMYSSQANQYFLYPRAASNRSLLAFRDWLIREFSPDYAIPE